MRRYLQVLAIVLACLLAHAGDCPDTTIWLNAFDNNGAIKTDLRAEDLRIEIGGKPAQILSLSLDTRPRRILVLVDASGSIEAAPGRTKFGIALAAATFAADVIPPSSVASLFTLSDKLVRESNDFETRQQVSQKILELQKRSPKGRTALLDSIDQALTAFGDPQFGDVIYLATDGGDNHSKISISQLREKLVARGVRVFVFLVQRPRYFTKEELQGVNLMEDLAQSTGGVWVNIPLDRGKAELTQLAALAPQIVNQVEELYRVQLQAREITGKPMGVKVALADKSRKKEIREITYPRHLAPCLLTQ